MLKPAERDRAIKARPKSWMTPVVLVILREESSYGYELAERLKEFGFETMNPGTLYRTLRQMENEGFQSPSGKPPKVALHAGYTRSRLPEKHISIPGPRGVSAINTLRTLSFKPIRGLHRTPLMDSVCDDDQASRAGRTAPEVAGRVLELLKPPAHA